MQDYIYRFHGATHVTLELSFDKIVYPLGGQAADNIVPTLRYINRVHQGVRGVVTSSCDGLPLAATVAFISNSEDEADKKLRPVHTKLQKGNRVIEPNIHNHTAYVEAKQLTQQMKIVGGTNAEIREFPFVVALFNSFGVRILYLPDHSN